MRGMKRDYGGRDKREEEVSERRWNREVEMKREEE